MKHLLAASLIALMAFNISCAKKTAGQVAQDPGIVIPEGPYVPDGNGPGEGPGESLQYGGTATLAVSSLAVMGEYTGRPMNNPTNIKINLNLLRKGKSDQGDDTYGGVVTVTYTENGSNYEGYFTSGSSANHNKFNVWMQHNGKSGWHGVFEDYLGGVVVVIDEVVDLGDGQGPSDSVGGTIWFKNFGLTYAPHPPTHCWFVSLGPYDCRPWPDGRGMNTYSSLDPAGGYKKLGKFSGMSLKKAFNEEL